MVEGAFRVHRNELVELRGMCPCVRLPTPSANRGLLERAQSNEFDLVLASPASCSCQKPKRGQAHVHVRWRSDPKRKRASFFNARFGLDGADWKEFVGGARKRGEVSA